MISINNYLKAIAACAAAGVLLSGCATNGAATIPSTTQANLNADVLQMAVGTVNYGQEGTTGLNVVTTLRQPSGATAILADLPTITGPAGFTVPAGTSGAYSAATYGTNTDAGTGHISGSPQVPQTNAGLINTTLGTFTGVYSYGFGPYNCDTNCTNLSAYYPGNPNATGGNGFTASRYACGSAITWTSFGGSAAAPTCFITDVGLTQPFYATTRADEFDYIVGPPAVPFFRNGTYPSGFAGYSPGFTTFNVTPVTGTYTLNVNVAAQNASTHQYTATAALNSLTPLGAIAPPTAADAAGGLTGTFTVPAGVTEAELYVVDVNGNSGAQSFYTQVFTGLSGAPQTLTYTIPGNLGACVGSGCQSGANAGASFHAGDDVFVAAVGMDYPAFEAGPPNNTSQKPTIAGANGQADLTLSPYTHVNY